MGNRCCANGNKIPSMDPGRSLLIVLLRMPYGSGERRCALGSPIKGPVKGKNTSPWEIIQSFSLTGSSFPHESPAPGVFRTRYFRLWFAQGLVARISHPSGSRHLLSISRLPLVLSDPRKSSEPCRFQLYRCRPYGFESNPLVVIGIGGAQQSRGWVQQVPIGAGG
jgi:hypothetical protein